MRILYIIIRNSSSVHYMSVCRKFRFVHKVSAPEPTTHSRGHNNISIPSSGWQEGGRGRTEPSQSQDAAPQPAIHLFLLSESFSQGDTLVRIHLDNGSLLDPPLAGRYDDNVATQNSYQRAPPFVLPPLIKF